MKIEYKEEMWKCPNNDCNYHFIIPSTNKFEAVYCPKCKSELNKLKGGKTTMASIIDSAKAYEPKQTLNIADLSEVDVNLDLQDRTGTDNDGKEFSYQVAVIEGKEYRVPAMVLEKLKEALKIRPDIKKIKVNRSGSGLNTRYSIEVLT